MRTIGLLILTPFLPEDNWRVITRKNYIFQCAKALVISLILTNIGEGLLHKYTHARGEILVSAVFKLYLCGTIISMICHCIRWKNIDKRTFKMVWGKLKYE